MLSKVLQIHVLLHSLLYSTSLVDEGKDFRQINKNVCWAEANYEVALGI